MTSPLTRPPASPDYEDAWTYDTTQKHMLWTVGIVAAFLGLIVLVFVLVSTAVRGQPLYPSLPLPTPPNRVISADVVSVSFTALNDNPAAYLGQRIHATGDYTPLELPTCHPVAGPQISWSLVADSLQLNATGYEQILRLAEPGMTLTVEGIWRLYSGPLGCGKEPPDGVMWYLAVTRIIEPNPLFGGPRPVLTYVAGQPTQAPAPTDAFESTPSLVPTAVDTDSESLEITPTIDGTLPNVIAPEVTVTPLPVTPLATPEGGITPLPTGVGTPLGTPTATGTVDPNATQTVPADLTPGIPTSTPGSGGYPVPSPSPEGYP